jgi:hypothetical protein
VRDELPAGPDDAIAAAPAHRSNRAKAGRAAQETVMNILPKDHSFYDLFQKQAGLILDAAELLAQGIKTPTTNWSSHGAKLHDLERQGDNITHETMKRLHQTFITPIDPEDIHSLCMRLDDVLDMIDEVGSWFKIFQIGAAPEPVVGMADIMVEASRVTVEVFEGLGNGKEISERLVKIHDFEEKADGINHDALVQLFRNETDPIHLIKLKEIYQLLEETADCFEEVAHVVEGVVLKNA